MNNAESDSLLRITKLSAGTDITPVLAHHAKKSIGAKRKPLSLEDMTWAGFAEFARQWIAISRRKEYVDGTGRHELHVKIGGSAGHSQLLQLNVDEGVRPNRKWDVTVKTGREAAAENTNAAYQSDAEKVRKTLTTGPLCKTPLSDAAGIRSNRIDDVLERMMEENIIEVKIGSRIKYELKR